MLTTIDIETGMIRGERLPGVTRFRGIPFGAPPVGSRRWQPPEPPEPWTGVRDCIEPGPIPPQQVTPFDQIIGAKGLRQSEDCLNLNVWTPACDDGSRPVLVWMYGGSFAVGAGTSPLSDGARLAAAGDVVVVTFNYRLGLLGFLPVGSILGERFDFAANTGLLDVAEALRWVRDNIAAFGGDPSNVTTFGQSAGGTLAALSLAIPSTQGLVRRAIVQSSGFHVVHPAHDTERIGEMSLDALGIDISSSDRLEELPIEAFFDAYNSIAVRFAADQQSDDYVTSTMPLQPAVDGAIIPDDPHALLRARTADSELLIGITAEELYLSGARAPGASPASEAVLRSRAERLLPGLGPDAGTRMLDMYRAGRPDASLEELWLAITTDAWTHVPARRLAKAHRGPTHMYRFDFRAPTAAGPPTAYHGVDIPFPWQTLDADGSEARMGPVTDEARQLSSVMCETWATFARTGTPAHAQLPRWPTWHPERPIVMSLDEKCRLVRDPEDSEHALWDE